MYQGGYSNFAARRAARHGKTKQYKAALEQKQNSNNDATKLTSDGKSNYKGLPMDDSQGESSKKRDLAGHPRIMAYPSAKGMEEITGDSLLIKCFKYIPPAISVDYKLERGINEQLADLGLVDPDDSKERSTTIKDYYCADDQKASPTDLNVIAIVIIVVIVIRMITITKDDIVIVQMIRKYTDLSFTILSPFFRSFATFSWKKESTDVV